MIKFTEITVVLPLYNKTDLILKCLNSIENQTYKVDEVIIVNDGSTDDSLDKVVKFCDGKPNYRVINQENSGVSAARNRGIEASVNQFVALIDADDEWENNHISTMVRLISDFPDAVMYSTAHGIRDFELGYFVPKGNFNKKVRGFIDDFFLSSCKYPLVNSSKVVLNKSLLTEMFPVEAVVSEDLYLWIKLALNGKVVFDPAVTVCINQMQDESRKNRTLKVPYPIEYFSKRENFGMMTKELKKYLFKIYFNHLMGSLLLDNRSEFFVRLSAAKNIFPFSVFFLRFLSFFPSEFYVFVRRIKRRSRSQN
ncbi:glycosyltransferase family 2 protein [Vibrio vulnificus]|uniref:glycosyltransferase family 2 protein n=1 Tax=Vibrio vulnificus TaxID=672 RepID=UPI004058F97D